jgi:hypothetical protein
MTYLLVTDAGLQGTRQADSGGFKLNITEFAVTQEQNVSLTVGDVELQGQEVYRGSIDTVEAIGVSTVKFTLSIPSSFPNTGVWNLREIGLFLDTGELFAHGVFPATMEKTTEFGVRFFVIVTAGRLGEVINVSINNLASIPSSPYVRALLKPNDSKQNLVAVLDENSNLDGSHSAGLAIQYGIGSSYWSFIGYKRQVVDFPETIFNQGSFEYPVSTKGGFWLNDGENVIIQIVAGPGQGETRKMSFIKSANTFTVIDKNFTYLTNKSKIAIWRDSSNVLPKIESSMPDYFVLGAGKNNWLANTVNLTAGSLVPYRSSQLLRGNLINTGTEIPLAVYGDTTKFIVHVDGKLLAQNQYTAAAGKVTTTVAATNSIDVLAFEFIPNTGSSLYFYEAIYQADGTTSTFQLPIVPDSAKTILVYLDGKLVPVTEYTLNDSKAIFNNTAPVGTVTLVPFVTYGEIGVKANVTRDKFITNGTEVDFTISSVFALRKDTLLIVGGKYVAKDNYTVNASRLILANDYTIPVNTVVEIFNFAGLADANTGVATGSNTGPEWIDPAGTTGQPNKLVPKVLTYVGNGVNKVFNIVTVPNDLHLLVFVHGVFQTTANFYYSDLAIRFEDPIPNGYPIDIMCFQSEAHSGTQVVCQHTSLITHVGTLTYTIHNITDLNSVIVSINGAYQHRSTYTITANNKLNLTSVVEGEALEVWSFGWKNEPGFMTYLNVDKLNITTTVNYPMTEQISSRSDTLAFVGGAQLHKSNRYNLDNSTGFALLKLINTPFEYQKGLPLSIVEFASKKPTSRLMTRAEIEGYFMPLRGPHVSWDNLTDRLKSILACPTLKLLELLVGADKAALTNPLLTADDKTLAKAWGYFRFYAETAENLIPIVDYFTVGTEAYLDLPVQINLFSVLERWMRTSLNKPDFVILPKERSKKYEIWYVNLAAKAVSQKTPATMKAYAYSNAFNISAWSATGYLSGTTTPHVAVYDTTRLTRTGDHAPLYIVIYDAKWWIDRIGSQSAGLSGTTGMVTGDYAHIRSGNNSLHTVSIVVTEDLTHRYFVHTIRDDAKIGGADQWTIKITKAIQNAIATSNNDTRDFLTITDADGAPLYVQFFARIYASLQYNDADIRNVIYLVNLQCWTYSSQALTPTAKVACSVAYRIWEYVFQCQVGIWSPGGAHNPSAIAYPARNSYATNPIIVATLDKINYTTGAATFTSYESTGTVLGQRGYTPISADMFLNSVVVPINFAVYPGVHVNNDGTMIPIISNEDVFQECCWTDVAISDKPNCGSETPPLPILAAPPPVASISASTIEAAANLTVTVNYATPGAVISWESSDNPNVIANVGTADATGFFSITLVPGGNPRVLTFKIYITGAFLSTVGTVVTATAAQVTHGSAEFVVNGTFTVPVNVFTLTAELLGAAGGGGGGNVTHGGKGGSRGQYITSSVTVIPREILTIVIGQPGQGGQGSIEGSLPINDGTSGTNTMLVRQNGTILLTAVAGQGGQGAFRAGAGTNGQSSELGIGGLGGAPGALATNPLTGEIVNYVPPTSGTAGNGYAAGGGGGGASLRDIADGIAGAPGAPGTKGWMKLTY